MYYNLLNINTVRKVIIMTMKRKVIEVHQVIEDQKTYPAVEEGFTTWFNECGESIKLSDGPKHAEERKHYKDLGYVKGVQPSDVDTIIKKITECIEKEDSKGLNNVLSVDFIYPVMVAEKGFTNGPHDHGIGEEWNVRQNIEYLYLEKPEYFAKLINKLIEKNNKPLMAAFLTTIMGSELGSKSLMSWNKDVKTDILSKLQDMYDHGTTLTLTGTLEANNKGKTIQALAKGLMNQIHSRNVDTLTMPSPKALLEELKFKLHVVKELHSHDQELAEHRDKGLVTDLVRNIGFFSQTATQAKVASAQEAIGFNPRLDG